MNGLERIRAVIAGQPCDHLPAQPMLMLYAAKFAGMPFGEYCRDGRKMAEAQLVSAAEFGLDALLTCSDPAREVVDIAGEDSVVWFEDQPPAIEESRAALADPARLKGFRVPDPGQPGRMHDRIIAIQAMRRAVGETNSVVGWVEGPLALAAELRGLNNIMIDVIDDPGFVRRLLAFTADVAIRYADAQVRAGADTIGMSDAAASLMGPAFYRELLWPEQLRVLTAIRGYGAITRLHMCGNTNALLADMARLPADIVELDFPVVLPDARRILGPNRVILGNVSTIDDLLNGTPAQVTAATAHCHHTCGQYHIVGAGCEVSPQTPEENLRALTRYAHEHQP